MRFPWWRSQTTRPSPTLLRSRRTPVRRDPLRLMVEQLEDRCVPDATLSTVHIPLAFELNQGQTDSSVNFLASGQGYNLFLTPGATALSLNNGTSSNVLWTQLVGANTAPQIVGQDQLAATSNYFLGNDSSQWITNVPNFGQVAYQNVYNGVNLVYHSSDTDQLEYDFVVNPGADASQIQMSFAGAQGLSLDAQGNLLIHMSGGDVVQNAPVLYQTINGVQSPVSGNFVLEGGNQVGFAVGAYDHSQALTIDPTLGFSNYLGGSNNDAGNAIAVDGSGNVYVAGQTASTVFPTEPSTATSVVQFVNVTAGGNYASTPTVTFSGGGAGAIQAQGTAILTGTAVTGVNLTFAGSGYTSVPTIMFSGGGGGGAVATATIGIPTSQAQISGPNDAGSATTEAFVTKLSSSGQLLYSAHLGGVALNDTASATGIAVDANQLAYITGFTTSADFPTTANAISKTSAGNQQAFFTILDTKTDSLAYRAPSNQLLSAGLTDPMALASVPNLVSGLQDLAVTSNNSNNAGQVTTTNITFAGSGYTSAPSVTFTGGGALPANQATATATIFAGKVVNITLLTAGSGYTSAPTITIAAPVPGPGTTATATATISGGSVTALVNNGNGSFTPTLYNVGVSPDTLAVGNFTASGSSDLAVGQEGGGVSVLQNNFSGSYTPIAGDGLDASVVPHATAIATGNINSVGGNLADLVIADDQTPAVYVCLGQSGGGFNAPSTTLLAGILGGIPRAVALGDFNGDGKLDLVVVTNNGFKVFTGDGTGGFGGGTFTQPNVTGNWTSVTVGDFNGEGLPDLALADTAGNVTVFLNTFAGAAIQFGGANQFTVAAGHTLAGITVGSFTNDGRLDIAVTDTNATAGNPNVIVLRNQSQNDTLAFGPTVTTGISGGNPGATAILATPLSFKNQNNNKPNGLTDLVVANTNGGAGNSISVLANNDLPVYSTYLGAAGDVSTGTGIVLSPKDATDNYASIVGTFKQGSAGGAVFTGASAPVVAYNAGASGAFANSNAFVVQFTVPTATPSNPGIPIDTFYGAGANTAVTGNGIAVDNVGVGLDNVYIVGSASATGALKTSGAGITFTTLQAASGGGINAFVAEFDPTLTQNYGTYYGGGGTTHGNGIAVDGTGNQIYITGDSTNNIPAAELANAIQNNGVVGAGFAATFGGAQDAFVANWTKGNATVNYGSYIGSSGTTAGNGIAVDASGNAYVIGTTNSGAMTFNGSLPTPLTVQAGGTNPRGGGDAFVIKVLGGGSAGATVSGVGYFSFLGGSLADTGNGITTSPFVVGTGFESLNNPGVYVTGSTASANFPVIPANTSKLAGGTDAFLMRIEPNAGPTVSTIAGTLTEGDPGTSPTDKLTITGTGFDAATTVSFQNNTTGASASLATSFVSVNQVTVVIPNSASNPIAPLLAEEGNATITVKSGEGVAATFTTFTIAPVGTPGATEAGNTVTITTTAANNYASGQMVTISGFSGAAAGYNGTFTITAVGGGGTTFSYIDPNTALPNSGGGTVTPGARINEAPLAAGATHPDYTGGNSINEGQSIGFANPNTFLVQFTDLAGDANPGGNGEINAGNFPAAGEYQVQVQWENTTRTGTTTNGSANVTLTGGFTTEGLVAGEAVSGPGIAAGTTINTITGLTTFTLSVAAGLGAGTGPITFNSAVQTFTSDGAGGDGAGGSLTYNTVSHVFSFTQAHTYPEEGDYFIIAKLVHDTSVLFSTTTAVAPNINVTVNDAALNSVAANLTPPVATEGTAFGPVTVFHFTDADPNGAVSDYKAIIVLGDGTTVDSVANPGNVTIVANGGGGFDVQLSYKYTEELPASQTFSVAVTDLAGGSTQSTSKSTATFGVADAAIPNASLLQGAFPGTIYQGQQIFTAAQVAANANVIATFHDNAGANSLLADFNTLPGFVTVAWGDGTTTDSTSGGGNGITIIAGAGPGDWKVLGNHTYLLPGPTFGVTVTVHDEGGAANAVLNFNLTETNPLSNLTLALPASTEGNPIYSPGPTGDIATFQDALIAPTGTETAANFNSGGGDVVVTWGDGLVQHANLGQVTVTLVGAVFHIQGNHTYNEEGAYPTFKVNVIDSSSATLAINPGYNVGDAGLAFAAATVLAPVSEGPPGTGNVVVATFTDSNPLATVAGDYPNGSATINWGDGSANTTGTVTFFSSTATSVTFTVTGSHIYEDGGPYNISTQVVDVGTSSIGFTNTASITVTGLPIPAANFTGSAFGALRNVLTPVPPGTLVTFIDPGAASATDLDGLSITVMWGDGVTTTLNTTSLVTSVTTADSFLQLNNIGVVAGQQQLQLVGQHDYLPTAPLPLTMDGKYTNPAGIHVTVVHDGSSTTVNDELDLGNVPVTLTAAGPITSTEGASTGNVTVATFTQQGGYDVPGDYSATIFWGDGMSSAGTITYPGGVATVMGSHVYAEDSGGQPGGVYTVMVQVVHAVPGIGNQPATCNLSATVNDAALTGGAAVTINAVEGAGVSGVVVATFTDANPAPPLGDFSATITWGDGTTSTGTIQALGANVFQIVASKPSAFAEEGTYGITVTIKDVGGSSVTVTGTVAVADAKLSGTGVSFSGQATITLTPVVATFSDADPAGTVTDYTVSIAWGDGAITGGTVTASGNGFAVSGAHAYGTRGTFTVTITIRDAGGSSLTLTATATIAGAPDIIATGADAGGGPEVKVFDAATHALKADFYAFPSTFTGGVRVAVGDVNGDGIPDVVAVAGPGGGPEVVVFDGANNFQPMAGVFGGFYALTPTFIGGLYVAVGDVNGDGFGDIIVGAGEGGGPEVAVFSGQDGSELANFYTTTSTFTGGVRVAAGDVEGIKRDDIIVSYGPGSASIVEVINFQKLQPVQVLAVFNGLFTGGLYVAAGDVNGDGHADIIVSAGPGGGPEVLVYDGAHNGTILNAFFANIGSQVDIASPDGGAENGVRVGIAHIDSRVVITTIGGPGALPLVSVLDGASLQQLDAFFAYDPTFRFGGFVS